MVDLQVALVAAVDAAVRRAGELDLTGPALARQPQRDVIAGRRKGRGDVAARTQVMALGEVDDAATRGDRGVHGILNGVGVIRRAVARRAVLFDVEYAAEHMDPL